MRVPFFQYENRKRQVKHNKVGQRAYKKCPESVRFLFFALKKLDSRSVFFAFLIFGGLLLRAYRFLK